jgi:hypothetical protein
MRRLTPLAATAAVVCAGGLLSQALAAGGSLSITPSILEHEATPGRVAQVTVANATGTPLRITVTPRPWLQGRSGRVVADRRHTLLHQVSVSRPTFTLAGRAHRVVMLTLLRRPSGGSLYGSVEVVGLPTAKPKANGIVADYRLVSSLRLDPARSARRIALHVSGATIAGPRHARAVVVALRNTGNTITPVRGTAKITGKRGTVNGSLASVAIVPRATVDFTLTRVAHLPKGAYRAVLTIRQATKTFTATRRFAVK